MGLSLENSNFTSESNLNRKDLSRNLEKILIVDDDEHTRELLKMLLQSDSRKLTLCDNSDRAIEEINKEFPDVILLDVKLPGSKDGYELCNYIKKMTEGVFIPIILITGNVETEQKIFGLNSGADDYVTKPFNGSELRARINAHLRTKFLTDQLKETQYKLLEKEKELIAAKISGGAAHSLGQPLTSIILHCEVLGQLEHNSTEFKESLSEIKQLCLNVKKILSNISKSKTIKTRQYSGELEIIDFENIEES